MDKRKYYRDLISLYEASAMGMAGTPEVVPQEQIADSGSDVNGMGAQVQDPNYQDPNIMQDPSMSGIDPMTGMPIEPQLTPEEQASQVLEKEKFKKLFSLYKDLLNLSDVFVENLKFIDVGLIDLKRYEKLKLYTSDVKKLSEKINSYMINIFNNETYEKVLYSYILFRTELITAIKGLRDILKLDHPDEDINGDKQF